jgi:hypothetical protein
VCLVEAGPLVYEEIPSLASLGVTLHCPGKETTGKYLQKHKL